MHEIKITPKILLDRYSKELIKEVRFIEDNLGHMPITAKTNMIFHNCLAGKIKATVEDVQHAQRDFIKVYRK
jgi:hypothetical protein